MKDHVDVVLAQWAAERPDLDALPMGVIGRISRVGVLLGRELGRTFAHHGLQSGEFDILATLRRSGAPFTLTAGALSQATMVTSGAITNRIDRLVAKGLVTRRVDPDNRRTCLITLSRDGRRLIDDAVEAHLATEEALLEGLTAQQRAVLADLLRTLALHLGDGRG